MQVDDGAVFLETLAIARPEHRATASGQHDSFEHRQLGDRHFLAVAKAGLAFDLENRRYGHPKARLELGIRIDEPLVQAARQLAAKGGLPRAGEPDQKQIAPVQQHRGRQMESGILAAGRGAHRTEVTVSLTMRGVRKMSSSTFWLLLPVCLKR